LKILVSSHRFAPDIGGIETVGRLLCREFVKQGHELCVLTESPGENDLPYQVVRRPEAGELLKWSRWADVVFHNNISLKHAWPLMVLQKPWVAAVHVWISRPDGSRDVRDRMKLAALQRAGVISVSRCIAQSLPFPSQVVPDPYDRDVFYSNDSTLDTEVAFVGRLVSDKGVDLLLRALALLKGQGLRPSASIIGDGPERAPLAALAEELGIRSQVVFHGALPPDQVAESLRRSRIMVVPSRWIEPFGIVALEGLGCGCRVIAANGGGLEEAVGACGILFKRGDAEDLARCIAGVLSGRVDPPAPEAVQRHLQQHSPEKIAAHYLSIFEKCMTSGAAR